MTTINNLTKHDSRKFKVGDLVYTTRNNFIPFPFQIEEIVNGIAYGTDVFKNDRSERLELLKLSESIVREIESDNCSDIRNHVSPSTLVWDLAGGEDWTAGVDL